MHNAKLKILIVPNVKGLIDPLLHVHVERGTFLTEIYQVIVLNVKISAELVKLQRNNV